MLFCGELLLRNHENKYLQRLSFLRQPKANPEASLRVIPVQSSFVADDKACPALETRFIGKVDPVLFLIKLVATGRTHEGARLVGTLLTDIAIHLDMRFLMDAITDKVEDVIRNHTRDLPPFIRSEMSCFTGSTSFTAFHPVRPKFFLGFPSER